MICVSAWRNLQHGQARHLSAAHASASGAICGHSQEARGTAKPGAGVGSEKMMENC